jgi:hypothetical protein
MVGFKSEMFLTELRKQLVTSFALIRKPEEPWERRRANAVSRKDIYYYLIFPLLFIPVIINFWIQLFDGFSSAGLYVIIGLVLNVLNIYLISLFLAYLNRVFKGDRDNTQVYATAPYLILPWIFSAIISGILALLFPFLAGIAWVIIFLAATITGMDMLYNYIVFFLKIPPERKGYFFLLAFGGMIVISASLFLLERFLEYNYIER